MKATVDIPKREALVGAIQDFNRCKPTAELIRYAGTSANFITPDQLQAARRQDQA